MAHSGGSMVISAGLAGLIVLTSGGNGLAFVLVLLLAATAYIAALFFVITSLFLLASNRKSLYKLVQNYKEGKGLPRRISRKKSFLRVLKKEQNSQIRLEQ